ncbi:uncharacterized protein [Elaeis guineensis]|uniref:uncharacterized protein n=1 Tax=Elaeis guineensis var. tenera TaxID=51953 RepID=UPI003C6D9807
METILGSHRQPPSWKRIAFEAPFLFSHSMLVPPPPTTTLSTNHSPIMLTEFTLMGSNNDTVDDCYDMSLVDRYNMGMEKVSSGCQSQWTVPSGWVAETVKRWWHAENHMGCEETLS